MFRSVFFLKLLPILPNLCRFVFEAFDHVRNDTFAKRKYFYPDHSFVLIIVENYSRLDLFRLD